MNKPVVLSVILVFLLLVILPFGLTFAIRLIPGGVQPSLGNTVKIYNDYIYSQSFVSPGNNLTGIGTSIKNPNFANKKPVTINLYDESDKLLRTVTLSGQNIADGKFIKILFEPVIDSKNKKFTWSIFSKESIFTDALELFLTDKQPTWSLGFKVNDKPQRDGLSYVTLHRPETPTVVLNKVVGGWFNKISGDNAFLFGYAAILVVLIATLYFPNLH